MARAQIQQTYLSAKSSGSDPLKLPEAAFSGVSVDEAFNRALGAMYWCGYWTACYHVSVDLFGLKDRSYSGIGYCLFIRRIRLCYSYILN